MASKAGLDSQQLSHCLKEMKTEEVKTELKQVTAEAVERGAFGAPTMFFSEEGGGEHMFWGSDRSVRLRRLNFFYQEQILDLRWWLFNTTNSGLDLTQIEILSNSITMETS